MNRVSRSTGSRGCGSRKAGGLYVCTGLSEEGLPIESFLVDPVRQLDIEPFRAPIPFKDPYNPDLWHILVWVGAEHYPSPIDFVEEARYKGISRRIPSRMDLSMLTPGKSRMVLVHPRAFTERIDKPQRCPTGVHQIDDLQEPCIGAHYAYLAALRREPLSEYEHRAFPLEVGDLSVDIFCPQVKVELEEFSPGSFLQVPITHFEYQAKNASDEGPETLQAFDDKGWKVDIIDDPSVYQEV